MAKQQTAPYKHEPGLNACVCFSGVPADQPEDSNEHCVIVGRIDNENSSGGSRAPNLYEAHEAQEVSELRTCTT